MKKAPLVAALLAGVLNVNQQAEAVDFSAGIGYPFFLVPEVSITGSSGNHRLYANYKLGLDDGFALGIEQAIDNAGHNAVGVFAGAVGIYDDGEKDCNSADEQNASDVADAVGCAIASAMVEAFDDEAINGIGVSYSYNSNGLNNTGWRVRLELGYGKSDNSKEKSSGGAVVVSYQF